jgi:enoyl-CoA hydratase/carnithine racemase
MPSQYSYPFYNVTVPQEHVLHAGNTFSFVFILEINRPDALNAFNSEYSAFPNTSANPSLMKQTADLFTEANNDSNVRTVILSARGKAFSAGLDR